MSSPHEFYMSAALAEAQRAAASGEVPVGAVVVLNGEVIGAGHNQPISSSDPTAHAEIVAIREAAARLKTYRLTGATMYVTVEPCVMCIGAIMHARIGTVVFGTPEPKSGAIESTQRAHEHPALNHRITVISGVLAAECRDLMQSFFRTRRQEAGI